MPELMIKPTPAWSDNGVSLGSRNKREFVETLIMALREDVVAAWKQIGWDGTCEVENVLPDIALPFNVVVAGTTPDLDIRIRPNYTWEKEEKQFEFLEIFQSLATERIKQLATYYRVSIPEHDVHVDFIVGCGTNINYEGIRTTTWPKQPLNAS